MHAFGQIEIRQNRRARRRKARNGFEKTVEIIRNTSVEKKRQRADRGNQNPGQAFPWYGACVPFRGKAAVLRPQLKRRGCQPQARGSGHIPRKSTLRGREQYRKTRIKAIFFPSRKRSFYSSYPPHFKISSREEIAPSVVMTIIESSPFITVSPLGITSVFPRTIAVMRIPCRRR